MNKEPLEALKDFSKLAFIYGGAEQYKIIETALKELEDIKSGKIRLSVESGENYVAVPKYQYERDLKKLKAFEIIKRKGVAVGFIQMLIKDNCGGVREYNDFIGDPKLYLTQEEYDLLKEVLL